MSTIRIDYQPGKEFFTVMVDAEKIIINDHAFVIPKEHWRWFTEIVDKALEIENYARDRE